MYTLPRNILCCARSRDDTAKPPSALTLPALPVLRAIAGHRHARGHCHRRHHAGGSHEVGHGLWQDRRAQGISRGRAIHTKAQTAMPWATRGRRPTPRSPPWRTPSRSPPPASLPPSLRSMHLRRRRVSSIMCFVRRVHVFRACPACLISSHRLARQASYSSI